MLKGLVKIYMLEDSFDGPLLHTAIMQMMMGGIMMSMQIVEWTTPCLNPLFLPTKKKNDSNIVHRKEKLCH
jgi:hypothetical protein